MGTYKNILVAVDLTDEASEVLTAAKQVQEEQNADLQLLTVVRPLRYAYGGYDAPAMIDGIATFESEAREAARTKLTGLCDTHKITPQNINVAFGKPADEIKKEAERLECDLIILGTHGRHGLGLLLGSTANGVLHGSPCDALTIRIHHKD